MRSKSLSFEILFLAYGFVFVRILGRFWPKSSVASKSCSPLATSFNTVQLECWMMFQSGLAGPFNNEINSKLIWSHLAAP